MDEYVIINNIERYAAKHIQAFVLGYLGPNSDGSVSIMRTKKWPAYYIEPKGDKYKVYVYRAKQGLSRIFKKDPEKYLKKFVENDYLPDYFLELEFADDKEAIKQLLRSCEVEIIRNDFFRRDFPTDTIKIIPKLLGENIFISQEIILSKQKLLDLLVGKEKLSIEDFTELFGQVEFEEGGRIETIKYKNWTILVDNKTKRAISGVKKLLSLTEKSLNSKGFGNLAYGRVMLVDKLRGRKVADYSHFGDIIRLESQVKASKKELTSMLHEIGHRNYYKYLDSSKRLESDTLYNSLKKKRGYFKRGDTLVDTQEPSEKYQLLSKSGTKYIVRCIDSGNANNIGEIYNIKNIAMGTRLIKETDDESKTKSSFFPRLYGLKDKLEFYAVLFETWLTKGLDEPAKGWFEGLHKGK